MLRSSIEGQSEVGATALQNHHNKVQFRHMVNSETDLSMFEWDLPQNICVIFSRAKKTLRKIGHSLRVEHKQEQNLHLMQFLFSFFNSKDTEKASKRQKTLALNGKTIGLDWISMRNE